MKENIDLLFTTIIYVKLLGKLRWRWHASLDLFILAARSASHLEILLRSGNHGAFTEKALCEVLGRQRKAHRSLESCVVCSIPSSFPTEALLRNHCSSFLWFMILCFFLHWRENWNKCYFESGQKVFQASRDRFKSLLLLPGRIVLQLFQIIRIGLSFQESPSLDVRFWSLQRVQLHESQCW